MILKAESESVVETNSNDQSEENDKPTVSEFEFRYCLLCCRLSDFLPAGSAPARASRPNYPRIGITEHVSLHS